MSRSNGELTFQTPISITPGTGAVNADTTATNGFVRMFTATERVTIVEVGAIAVDSTHVPSSAFTFRVKVRSAGLVANDFVVPVFKAAFAAQGGPAGDPSVSNFDNANQIVGGIITNTVPSLTAGKALRAYCEQSLSKGDTLVFEVVANGGASSVVSFYAKAYPLGAGLVEANDVDSN